MLTETIDDLKANIEKALDAFRKELARLRTGRASLAVIEGVRVDYYGSATPLSQMSSMSTPDPRTILIKPWDRSQVQVVAKAILQANLGLTPQVDGEFIRIHVPALTEERRRDLVKVVKKLGEEAKISVRGHRREANDMVRSLADDGEISEDDSEKAIKKVQELTDQGVKKVDEIVAAKEKDVLEI
ncbi:MAG: ribosome recycling factor [Myxococcota bacterium]|nr:ribosome recycling factor [Myxococcota bacterium]